MRLASDIMSRLRKARAEAAAHAVEKAIKGHPAAEDLAQLETYDKLIAMSDHPRRRNFLIAAGVAVLCVVAAGVIWAARIPTAKIHVTVVTDAVLFTLAEPWRWSGNWQLGDGVTRLDEMTEINLPPEVSTSPELKGRAWLDIDKGRVAINELEFEPRGMLAIFHQQTRAMLLLSRNAPTRGVLQMSGSPAVSAGTASNRAIELRTASFEIPGIISFYDVGRSSIPARLAVRVGDTVTWRNLPIVGLSFSREEGQAGSFVSGIRSGTVTMTETGEKRALQERDRLYLELASGTIQELEMTPDSLRISFEGVAKDVSIGVSGPEESLVPTWLDYIYHQQRLGFFWGAVVFLWGVLWSARELLRK